MSKKSNEAKKAMNNVQLSVKGDKLQITVSLKDVYAGNELPLSSKGRSYIVASTNGFEALEGAKLDGLSIGLNVTAKKDMYDAKRDLVANKEVAVSVQTDNILDTFAALTPAQKQQMLLDMINLASK